MIDLKVQSLLVLARPSRSPWALTASSRRQKCRQRPAIMDWLALGSASAEKDRWVEPEFAPWRRCSGHCFIVTAAPGNRGLVPRACRVT